MSRPRFALFVAALCLLGPSAWARAEEKQPAPTPAPPPVTWRLAPAAPVHIHVAKGMWWEFFQINEMLAWRRGGAMQSSYLMHGMGGSGLRGFPTTPTGITQSNVVLLANVDAPALGASGQKLLEEYVRQGGSLLVFGGRFAFTAGGYANTSIERLLPCTFDASDRQFTRDGLPIAPTELGAKWLPALGWDVNPRVFYYSRVTPREGAEVWLKAGDHPLLLAWKVGKGRVACWTGSVEGDPGPERLAFWEWGGLPATLDATLTWLVAEQTRPPEVFDPEVDGKPIDQLVTVSLEKDADARAIAIVEQLVARCNSADFARKLIGDLASADVALDRVSVNRLAMAVRPYVDSGWASLGQQLAAAERPGKAALGLRLLGFIKGPAASAELRKRLRATTGADIEAMSDTTQMGGPERILIGALQGAGDLGDPANLPAVTNIGKIAATQLPPDGDATITGDLRQEVYQHALLAGLKLGDAAAAGPLLDAVLRNILETEQYQNYVDMMLMAKNDIASIAGKRRAELRLPVLHERLRSLQEVAAGLPASAIPPLAAALAERNDAILLPFAFAAFGSIPGSKLDEPALRGVLPLIEKSTVAQFRLLGVRILQSSDSPAAGPMLAGVLERLAASEKPVDAIFALRLAGILAPGQRTAILNAAAKNTAPEVQRWVRLSRVP